MIKKKNVGDLIYCSGWRQIETREGDKATLINDCGTLAHILVDDGCWILRITKSAFDSLSHDGLVGITPWWFPEAVDVLMKLHLEEKLKA